MPAQFSIQSTPDLVANPTAEFRWLWDGYLAGGMVTLFTNRWKMGKTTLISFLLAKLKSGGTLADAAVMPGKAIVVSEEPAALWAKRHAKHDFGTAVDWCCRPFVARPTAAEWEELIVELAGREADLVVFDPLAMVLPGDVENNAAGMLAALAPLRLLTDAGAAVLVLHHPRKSSPAGELSPRGTGALTGLADILVELDLPPNAVRGDRRRWLRSSSRLSESTAKLLELAPDGLEYRMVPPQQEPDSFDEGWLVLKTVFEDSHTRLTRNAILKSWPEDHEKPSKPTLIRWLEKALQGRKIERRGKGRLGDPFEYCLPGFRSMVDDMPSLDHLRSFRRV